MYLIQFLIPEVERSFQQGVVPIVMSGSFKKRSSKSAKFGGLARDFPKELPSSIPKTRVMELAWILGYMLSHGCAIQACQGLLAWLARVAPGMHPLAGMPVTVQSSARAALHEAAAADAS